MRKFVDTQQKTDAESAKKVLIMFKNLNGSHIDFSCSYIFDKTHKHENLIRTVMTLEYLSRKL